MLKGGRQHGVRGMRTIEYGKWTINGIIPEGKISILSPRESEVLTLICRGWTNKAIADIFGTSEQTVKNQVSSVLTNLNCSNRAQAVAFALSGDVKFGVAPVQLDRIKNKQKQVEEVAQI